MSNSISGVNLAEVAQESLSALQSVFSPLGSVCTDFSSDISARGESVTTRYPSNPTAQNLASGYTRSDVTTTAKTVNLNTFYGFVWGFNDLERSKSAILLNDLFIQPAATALGRKVFGDLWNLVTATNF
ncbi:MAG: Verrucomicrobia phage, partial [Verrucomicrobiota bacterium]